MPPEDTRGWLGSALYQLLFGPPEADLFPRIAAEAWNPDAIAQANTLSVAVQIRCDSMVGDPWPLRLPWNLTTLQVEALAQYCAWSFEVTPPGVANRFGQSLTPEPELLLLCDPRAVAAARHQTQLVQYLDHAFSFAANVHTCNRIDQLVEQITRISVLEVPYL